MLIETDLDIPQNRLAESAERVLDRALDEARRREHAILTNEHVCVAFDGIAVSPEFEYVPEPSTDPLLPPAATIRSVACSRDHCGSVPVSTSVLPLSGPSEGAGPSAANCKPIRRRSSISACMRSSCSCSHSG